MEQYVIRCNTEAETETDLQIISPKKMFFFFPSLNSPPNLSASSHEELFLDERKLFSVIFRFVLVALESDLRP
jgi:hypothetical protein